MSSDNAERANFWGGQVGAALPIGGGLSVTGIAGALGAGWYQSERYVAGCPVTGCSPSLPFVGAIDSMQSAILIFSGVALVICVVLALGYYLAQRREGA